MKSELQLFNNPEFGEVRMVEINGKPYAVGNDVAKILGYASPKDAVAQHCKGAVKHRLGVQTGIKRDGSPAIQNIAMAVIPEGDLFRLIVKAADQSINPDIKEMAERFERWIFDEVIPAIYKTGKYETDECKRMNAEARAKNAQVRKAQELIKLADHYAGQTFAQVLHSYATVELTGERLIPLPELKAKTYSATEIGEQLGVSANKVGRLTTAHNLKTDEYGIHVLDKAKGHNKEVQSFRYYDTIIPVLEAILSQQSA